MTRYTAGEVCRCPSKLIKHTIRELQNTLSQSHSNFSGVIVPHSVKRETPEFPRFRGNNRRDSRKTRLWNGPQVTTPNPNTADKHFTVATPEVTAFCWTLSLLLVEHSPLREATSGLLPTQAAASPAKNVAAASTTFSARWKNRSVKTEKTEKKQKTKQDPDIQATKANFLEPL